MRRRFTAVLLVVALLLSLAACADEGELSSGSATESEWAIYWYLCGSDLESGGGFATDDLIELLEVELPENVRVVIETGGTTQWQNDVVETGKLQRYVYSGAELTLVDEQPAASMGDPDTLADFLSYASTNYPAEKTAVVFWDHGGGSASGVAFDEVYDYDSLTLDELYQAFGAVWTLSEEEPPLELIGFDACLMATVDVAYTFDDIARYLVASEETEPANGWYYSQWVGALAEDPSMDGAALGQIICDSYYAGCEVAGTQDNVTLSLTDLGKVGTLLAAYEDFGAEALAAACEDTGFFSRFGRAAQASENYGGNTKEQGYRNLVDLGHLAVQSSDLLSSAKAVSESLEECVLYRVSGQYRAEATGLSCYYSYDGDVDSFNSYASVGAGTAFKYFYTYELSGELDESGQEYVENLGIDELQEVTDLTDTDWEGTSLELGEDAYSYLTLGPEADAILAGIGFSLFYQDEENDLMLWLGRDDDIVADWENGVFRDNFRGVWGSIDGCLVFMELSFSGDGYNLYSVPILLNEEEYNLQVAYDFTEEQWSILGAWQGIDGNGMSDKELRLLEEGDEITTIWYAATYSGDDAFEPYPVETVTVTADTAFDEMELPDGRYCMYMEMRDAAGNTANSEQVLFDYADGTVNTTVY